MPKYPETCHGWSVCFDAFFLTRHENKLKSALIFNLIFSQGPQRLDSLWREENVNLADTFQAYSEGIGDTIKRFGVLL